MGKQMSRWWGGISDVRGRPSRKTLDGSLLDRVLLKGCA